MKQLLGLILMACVLFLTPLVAAQDPPQGGGDAMAEMMAAFMKYATPGEQHDKLKPMAGNFIVKAKFRMAPGQPWMESTSDVSGEWILGGRFLVQRVDTKPDAMMPEGFQGFGLFGYDNYRSKYMMTWTDTLSTMMLTAEGMPDGDVIAFQGTYTDPMSGQPKPFKWTYEIPEDGNVVQKMYEKGPDGEMFVNATLTYERKK